MTEAVVVAAEEAEVVGLAHGGAFRLLVDGDATAGTPGANRLTLPAGADGARPHRHERSAELFHVLGGRLEFLLGERSVTVGEGGLVVVPPGLVHAFGAAPGTGADVLVVMAPGVERFDYFRHLGRVSMGLEPAESLLPEQGRYDVHFVAGTRWAELRGRGA
ncbi:cupin domain-containing protein [Streptomyces sp. NPDC053367]|uniref:cupin domain-containing protein n=1 Tax=Streptomyces sp. NPDC053367 TaxID=3365700 RepID=UPI0037D4F734